MNTIQQFDSVCTEASSAVVRRYSTSFSIGIRALAPRFREPIQAIYAFVRFADEIVDTFHAHDKRALLQRFREDTYRALQEGISLNPILQSFQRCARRYGIDRTLIDPFLDSMAMDLDTTAHDARSYATYVMGSAEVVGLMCLRVFCEGDETGYERLKPAAVSLGAAFQKVNFLRDLQDDHAALGRSYFPHVDVSRFDPDMKRGVEREMEADFSAALDGIRLLPGGARFGVYTAYLYYYALFNGSRTLPPKAVMQQRIRVGKRSKLILLTTSYLKNRFNLI